MLVTEGQKIEQNGKLLIWPFYRDDISGVLMGGAD
jgi:hypothetical protein